MVAFKMDRAWGSVNEGWSGETESSFLLTWIVRVPFKGGIQKEQQILRPRRLSVHVLFGAELLKRGMWWMSDWQLEIRPWGSWR